MTALAQMMLIFALLWYVHQYWQKINRCHYCGTVNGHDQDCPMDYLNREER